MRVGVSLRSAYLTDNVRAGARTMIERAETAEAAGLDSLFVGDHHVVGIPYYQNVPMLARMLAGWGSRPCGALFLFPLWHPVLLAEQAGTLAALAKGRFVIQCAIGDGEDQFAGMGERLSQRAGRFEAAFEIVRALLQGESVTTPPGSPWALAEARIGPLPPEPVEYWIGGSAPRAIDRAARLGDAWLAGPELGSAAILDQLGTYLDALERHGRSRGTIAIRRDIHVGADDADAERVAGPIVGGGYRGFPPDATVVGGPETVAERLGELAQLGFTDVLLRHLAEEQSEVLASLERLAEVRRLVATA